MSLSKDPCPPRQLVSALRAVLSFPAARESDFAQILGLVARCREGYASPVGPGGDDDWADQPLVPSGLEYLLGRTKSLLEAPLQRLREERETFEKDYGEYYAGWTHDDDGEPLDPPPGFVDRPGPAEPALRGTREEAAELETLAGRLETADGSDGSVWPLFDAPVVVARHQDTAVRGRKQTRLVAYLDGKTPYLVLDGEPLPTFDELVTHYVARLIKADGEAVSYAAFLRADDRFKGFERSALSKGMNKIPIEIFKHIERPGKGKPARLKVEDLQ